MSFTSDVKNFHVKAIKANNDIIRATKLELFNSVIRDTPVDTGRARGNWQATINTPATNVIDRLDKTGASVSAEIEASIEEGDTVNYLSNNLPYIERLEDGYSDKSPAGMVRKNIARINRIINKHINKFKI